MAMERATPQPLGMGAATMIPVATAQDSIVAKLEWFRLTNETSERQWDDVAHQPEDRRGGAIDPAILGFRTGVRTDGLKQKLTRRTSENVSPWCFLRCLVLKNSG